MNKISTRLLNNESIIVNTEVNGIKAVLLPSAVKLMIESENDIKTNPLTKTQLRISEECKHLTGSDQDIIYCFNDEHLSEVLSEVKRISEYISCRM